MKSEIRKAIKSITGIFMILALCSFTGKETKTIEIKTSTVCDMCKDKIERELVFEAGIKSVKVDLKALTVTVKFRIDKTNPEAIRKAIAKLGYWADEVPANEEAFKNLPECCQKEGCGKK